MELDGQAAALHILHGSRLRVHDELLAVEALRPGGLAVARGVAGSHVTDHLSGDAVVVLVPVALARPALRVSAPALELELTPAWSLVGNASTVMQITAGGALLELKASGLYATLLPASQALRALEAASATERMGPVAPSDGPGDVPAYPGHHV